ncbi:TPA: hypothetical protein ACGZ2M_000276 [Citrobacter farmeri]
MEKWEMTAFCPLCKQVFVAKKFRSHLNKHHVEASDADKSKVEKMALIALNSVKRNINKKSKELKSATDLITSHRNGYTGTVSGGAFGQGKK